MEQNTNLHFFKEGIQPLWEDPANREGGKWVFTIKNDGESLTRSWLEIVSYIFYYLCGYEHTRIKEIALQMESQSWHSNIT